MKINNPILVVLTLVTAFFVCSNASLAGPAEEEHLKQFWEGHYVPLETVTEAARIVTNDELRQYNYNQDYYSASLESGERLNPFNYVKYGVLAYGIPHGTFDSSQEEYRYLGRTANGEAYTNTFFRPDFADGVQIDQVNWIKHPADDNLVKIFLKQMKEPELEPNNFNYQQRYRENILAGLILLTFINPNYYNFDVAAWFQDREWENYVHILQPPSKYSWGTGRMFRQLLNGSIRYMDVPLVSFSDFLLDFAVNLREESFQAKPSEVIESTATFELNPECPIPGVAKMRLYLKTATGETELPFAPVDPAKKLNGNQYTFQPGEKLEVRFSFTVPNEPAEIVGRIDRDTQMKYWVEKNLTNNEDRAPVIVGQYDVKVEIIPDRSKYTAFDSDSTMVSFKSVVTRKDDTPGTIKVRAAVSTPVKTYTLQPELGPGESVEYPMAFRGGTGCHMVEGDAWPDGLADVYPGDNHDSAVMCVEYKTFKSDSKIRVDIIDR